MLGPGHVDLGIDHPAHAHAHRRDVRGPHGGVRDHDDVAAELVALAAQQVGEMRRARFLLALDQQLERDGRRGGAARGQAGSHAESVEEHLTLVVRGSPGQQPAVALSGLERGRFPLIERLDRLHVVVTVDQHGRRGRVGGRPVREDRRHSGRAVAPGFPHFRHREAGRAQMRRQPVRGPADVGMPGRIGGDGRDGQPLLERAEEFRRMLVDVATYVHARDPLPGAVMIATLASRGSRRPGGKPPAQDGHNMTY